MTHEELMSEVTIKGVTWCRVDGGWWCTSASRLANGYDADTALDEVVRLREENARLRTAIEEALDGWKNSTAGWREALDGWKNSTAGWRDANNRNEELIGKLRDVLAAIRDLDGAHYPTTYGDGRPELCAVCGAADGSWPCTARQVADDLRRAIGEGL